MRALPTQFRIDGFDFVQIAREGDVALFRKTKPPLSFETFEVTIVQKRQEHQWPDGRVTPAHEAMPGNEDWGTHGWSLQSLDRAWEKFAELTRPVLNVTLSGSLT